jgi:cytochrome P450
LIADIIAARRANPRTSGDPDILDMILEARDPESGTPLSAKAIRDQVGTMLATGFETTACTIFWAAFLLARDRAELIAVREEIARHPPHSIASFEDFRHWPSLQRALNETLRLYPPIPVLLRVAVADDEIIGARIKPGDLVSVSPWVMHRHRRLWNAPEMFMPERFAQPERSYPPAYIPFGVGPRTCIGAAFAVTEAMLVLGHLLHRFDVTLDDDRPMSAKSVVATMPSVEPLFCLQRDRQDGQ